MKELKISEIDSTYFNKAEKSLYNEFMVVLGLSYDKVKEYVYDKVSETIKD